MSLEETLISSILSLLTDTKETNDTKVAQNDTTDHSRFG